MAGGKKQQQQNTRSFQASKQANKSEEWKVVFVVCCLNMGTISASNKHSTIKQTIKLLFALAF